MACHRLHHPADTGAGKTVVMAMLIAWQTLNKVHSPRDARFGNRFVVVTPGITIRDRLRVLFPNDADNLLRGFTRPSARITRDLQDEGIVDEGVEPMLSPLYGGGVTATDFEIPLEVVQILSEDGDS